MLGNCVGADIVCRDTQSELMMVDSEHKRLDLEATERTKRVIFYKKEREREKDTTAF